MRGRRAVVPLLTLMLATLLELSSVAARSVTFGEAQAAQAPAATELTGVEVGRNADGVTVTRLSGLPGVPDASPCGGPAITTCAKPVVAFGMKLP